MSQHRQTSDQLQGVAKMNNMKTAEPYFNKYPSIHPFITHTVLVYYFLYKT